MYLRLCQSRTLFFVIASHGHTTSDGRKFVIM